LLGFGETMDLINEQDRFFTAGVSLRRESSITWRTSLTPAVTADSSTNRRPELDAIRYARVVFPVPGGPHKMMEPGAALWVLVVGSRSLRSGEPGLSR
jgi:hypothetical protein